jgi:hypothetical protein
LDSFRTYLDEAQGAGARGVLWLPFPVHDFLQRAMVMRGGAFLQDVPQQLCVMPLDRRDSKHSPGPQRGTAKHHREHLNLLTHNHNPMRDAFLVPRS